jgi:hypothetical protein
MVRPGNPQCLVRESYKGRWASFWPGAMGISQGVLAKSAKLTGGFFGQKAAVVRNFLSCCSQLLEWLETRNAIRPAKGFGIEFAQSNKRQADSLNPI